MGPVYTTRKFTFSAAHRYWRDEWSAEENARVFGHLTVPHGHNYVLEVTLRGSVDAKTGMLMDLAELKRLVGDVIVARFDHADLNRDPLFAAGVDPDHRESRPRHLGSAPAQAGRRPAVPAPAMGGSHVPRGVLRLMGAFALTRAYHFSAAHRLVHPGLDERRTRGCTASASASTATTTAWRSRSRPRATR